jgi:hypothetical protein
LKVAGFGEGARTSAFTKYLAGVPVQRDREPEGVEDAAPEFGVGGRKGFSEIGEVVGRLFG